MINAQLNRISIALENMTAAITEWNEQLVRNLIQTVRVEGADRVEVIFRDGLRMVREMQ
jgi:hypothetical protein